ncbi:MAG TPA: hypothetical protein VMV94_12305 [Phycisphaerae bacterium]|nr:hypothetical protein [Phycisphaerae bacterium]
MLFNYDWWFSGAFQQRLDEAKQRCALNHFPNIDPAKAHEDAAHKRFLEQLEARTILYLRDGFSYELKEIIKHPCTSALTFECMPADEAYKVGCFVVTVPFDDIVRVEIFAVHPQEKPEDMPSIKGFGSAQGPPGSRMDDRPYRREPPDRD